MRAHAPSEGRLPDPCPPPTLCPRTHLSRSRPTILTSPSTVVVTAEVRLIMAECTMLYTSALTEVKATIHSTPFECSGKYSTKRPDYGGDTGAAQPPRSTEPGASRPPPLQHQTRTSYTTKKGARQARLTGAV